MFWSYGRPTRAAPSGSRQPRNNGRTRSDVGSNRPGHLRPILQTNRCGAESLRLMTRLLTFNTGDFRVFGEIAVSPDEIVAE